MEDNSLLLYASILLISWAIYKFVLSTPHRRRHPPPAAIPDTNGTSAVSSTATATAGNNIAVQQQLQQQQQNTTRANNSNTEVGKNEEESLISYPQRHPPHLYITPKQQQQQQQQRGGDDYLSSTHLYHGIIPFKSTFASGYESRNNTHNIISSSQDEVEDLMMTNRKQRARLFAKLFTISDRPPNRGSNVVVIISYSHPTTNNGTHDISVAKCDKLQKSLMLLGTYYNIFLLVDYTPPPRRPKEENDNSHNNTSSSREVVKQFRNDLLNIPTTTSSTTITSNENDDDDDRTVIKPTTTTTTAAAVAVQNVNTQNRYKLSSQIIPPHRIIFTSTPEGQIAFVRQLNETKLILLMDNTTTATNNNNNNHDDDDNRVKVELERFGFRVVTYPNIISTTNNNNDITNGSGSDGECKKGSVVSALGQFLFP